MLSWKKEYSTSLFANIVPERILFVRAHSYKTNCEIKYYVAPLLCITAERAHEHIFLGKFYTCSNISVVIGHPRRGKKRRGCSAPLYYVHSVIWRNESHRSTSPVRLRCFLIILVTMISHVCHIFLTLLHLDIMTTFFPHNTKDNSGHKRDRRSYANEMYKQFFKNFGITHLMYLCVSSLFYLTF